MKNSFHQDGKFRFVSKIFYNVKNYKNQMLLDFDVAKIEFLALSKIIKRYESFVE